MANAVHVNDPVELTTLSTYLESHESPATGQHLHISLLQPLSKPEVLAVCRDPSTRFVRDAEGKRLGPDNLEILNLDALSSAWRSSWKTLPVDLIKSVTFDITLPEMEGKKKGDSTLYLTHDGEIEIAINQMHPLRLVILLATVMRVRSRREDGVQFDLVSDTEGMGNLQRAREFCRRLSKGST